MWGNIRLSHLTVGWGCLPGVFCCVFVQIEKRDTANGCVGPVWVHVTPRGNPICLHEIMNRIDIVATIINEFNVHVLSSVMYSTMISEIPLRTVDIPKSGS